MKKIIMLLMMLSLLFCTSGYAKDQGLEDFISQFDYTTRKDMKINSKELIKLLKDGQAQLIDIRFSEEYQAWTVGPSKNIPLNELPQRLAEIDNAKIVVTACPHKDRAAIAMVYLRSHGIQAKYLTDGLLGLAENLRGDKAKAFIMDLSELKSE